MGAKATLYLTERGVQVVGTDAWSWDAPFSHTARRWADTRDPSIIWEGHKAGRIRRSEEHTSELQSLMRISYAVFCLKKKKTNKPKYKNKTYIHSTTKQKHDKKAKKLPDTQHTQTQHTQKE